MWWRWKRVREERRCTAWGGVGALHVYSAWRARPSLGMVSNATDGGQCDAALGQRRRRAASRSCSASELQAAQGGAKRSAKADNALRAGRLRPGRLELDGGEAAAEAEGEGGDAGGCGSSAGVCGGGVGSALLTDGLSVNLRCSEAL